MILAHAGNYRSDAILKNEKSFWIGQRRPEMPGSGDG
jgi:hypothetical protein